MTHEEREMLDDLLDQDSGLTAWEIDFLESLDQWDGDLTLNQSEKLKDIYDRVIR